MRSLLALILLGIAASICGLDNGSRSSDGSTPSNSAPSQAKSTPSPAQDKAAVQSELTKLVNEIGQAAMDGDITYLARVTTDDFESTDVQGKVQDKNEALAEVKKEKTIRAFTISEAELISFSEDSAVLRYTLSVTLKNGRSGKAKVTDSFVREDGKWLLKSEQQTMMR